MDGLGSGKNHHLVNTQFPQSLQKLFWISEIPVRHMVVAESKFETVARLMPIILAS